MTFPLIKQLSAAAAALFSGGDTFLSPLQLHQLSLPQHNITL